MVEKMVKNILTTTVKLVSITLVAVAIAYILNVVLGALTANAPVAYVSAVSLIAAAIILRTAMYIHEGKENFLMLIPYILFIVAIYGLISMRVPLPEMVVNVTTAYGIAITASVVLLAIEITNRVLKMVGFKL